MSELWQDQPARPPMARSWAGEIASNPIDLNQRVDVKIPDMSPDLVFEGVRWQSRDSTSLPQRGDACLVVFDNDREPWVVVWWPFNT